MQVRSALSRIVGHACAAFVACAIVTGAAEARQPGTAYLGQPCTAVGELVTSGYVFVCSDANVFRYALHEDIPPAPEDGYVERPSWYPRLSEIFLATDPPACSITGRVTFTSPVIRPEHTTVIVPQGQLIFDHVTPIDHGYIGVTLLGRDPATLTDADFAPILAPADAEIIEISLLSATSIRIVLAHGCETYSVLMVVNRLSGALGYLQDDLMASGSLSPHIRVLAGEEIAAQRDNPLDFSVHVGASWLSGFVAPFSYTVGEAWKPFTVDPWPYFSPDLAEFYESRMQRLAPPRWGTIDHDIAGTASGNWFVSGTVGYSGHTVEAFSSGEPITGGAVAGKNIYSWSHLAIVRHPVQPGRWFLSTGWWQDEAGDPKQYVLNVTADQPEPSQLTPASGTVVYELWNWTAEPAPTGSGRSPWPIGYDIVPIHVVGIAAVQVHEDQTLSIELIPGEQGVAPSFPGFSAAKRTYRR